MPRLTWRSRVTSTRYACGSLRFAPAAPHFYVGHLMTKAKWLLVASPSITLMAIWLLDLVPPEWGVIYFMLAYLQGIFLLAAITRVYRSAPKNRVRSSAPKRESEQVTMPVWQKVVLSIIAIYGLLLVFVGALTKQ